MKRFLWVIALFFILITVVNFTNTYALFENDAVGNIDAPIGKWVIKLNEEDISSGIVENFVIDQVSYSENENIEDGYIAPGRSGYFDIIMDPNGTEVSIRYDITIDISEGRYPENISFSIDDLTNGTAIKTGENTYSGIIKLEDISSESAVKLRLNVYWDNAEDAYNDTDSELGTVVDNKIEVPVTVKVLQYLGEEITPYE